MIDSLVGVIYVFQFGGKKMKRSQETFAPAFLQEFLTLMWYLRISARPSYVACTGA